MNKFLATLLKVGEAVAVQTAGPAGAVVDAAVHNIVEKKGDVDSNIIDAVAAGIQAIEEMQGVNIADEPGFKAGCVLLDQGFKMVKASLKHDVPPAA